MSGIPPEGFRTPSPRMYTSTPMPGPSGEYNYPENFDFQNFQTPRRVPPRQPPIDETDVSIIWNSNFGVTIGTFVAQACISHPCIVLRRQCQVHRTAYRYHLWPWSLFPVMVRLQRNQGPGVLFKGASSLCIVRGMQHVAETVIGEVTPFPREVSTDSSLKQLIQHIGLKGLAFALVTPFSCAALVESVQSDVASDKSALLDLLRDGAARFVTFTRMPGRMVPLWRLLLPSAVYGIAQYTVAAIIKTMCRWFMDMRNSQRRRRRREERINLFSNVPVISAPTVEDKMAESCFTELKALYLGQMVADILLFPFETVLHRLYLQGTRTIVDNLDTGYSVIPILSAYEGPYHCWNAVVAEEGASGLYKGFGALILQYTLHGAALYGASALYRHYLETTLDDLPLPCQSTALETPVTKFKKELS